ncbi:short-chain dehydrogenase [Mycolicibacterium setense]|uniref:SDR family oxidoreductase n=1 Tax=Mycolicibacterium setense TaxID=431269 RepID=UPI0007EBE67C|nr:SDR family oxidoreductase [Mycolicibacterium setense]OBB17678.1 short-chain dehydrogenase [Mycolicibacterium setense]
MTDHVKDRVIIVTGAGGGFGRLIAEITAARGAKVIGADVNSDGLAETESTIAAAGGTFVGQLTDVTDRDQMLSLAKLAIENFGAIDVMINNAGTMPLAFYADHADAWQAWNRCIDINIKGILNGISAVYDQMITQGRGHVINISSIYGNFPVAGAAVYGATKAAVNVLSESLRVEAQGKVKVTLVKPTGVPATGLGTTIVNQSGVIGIVGHNFPTFTESVTKLMGGELSGPEADENSAKYWAIEPRHLADSVVYAIDQPWGVSIGDITVRATGENYIL